MKKIQQIIKKDEYQCAYCGKVYKKGWTDKEAKTEAEEIFGKHPDDWNDEQAIICDDCFQKIHPLKHPYILEKAKKQL